MCYVSWCCFVWCCVWLVVFVFVCVCCLFVVVHAMCVCFELCCYVVCRLCVLLICCLCCVLWCCMCLMLLCLCLFNDVVCVFVLIVLFVWFDVVFWLCDAAYVLLFFGFWCLCCLLCMGSDLCYMFVFFLKKICVIRIVVSVVYVTWNY